MSGIPEFDTHKNFYLPDIKDGIVTFNSLEKNNPNKTTNKKIQEIFFKKSDRVEETINAVTACKTMLKDHPNAAIEEKKLLDFVRQLKNKITKDLKASLFKSTKWSEQFGGLKQLTKLQNDLSHDIRTANKKYSKRSHKEKSIKDLSKEESIEDIIKQQLGEARAIEAKTLKVKEPKPGVAGSLSQKLKKELPEVFKGYESHVLDLNIAAAEKLLRSQITMNDRSGVEKNANKAAGFVIRYEGIPPSLHITTATITGSESEDTKITDYEISITNGKGGKFQRGDTVWVNFEDLFWNMKGTFGKLLTQKHVEVLPPVTQSSSSSLPPRSTTTATRKTTDTAAAATAAKKIAEKNKATKINVELEKLKPLKSTGLFQEKTHTSAKQYLSDELTALFSHSKKYVEDVLNNKPFTTDQVYMFRVEPALLSEVSKIFQLEQIPRSFYIVQAKIIESEIESLENFTGGKTEPTQTSSNTPKGSFEYDIEFKEYQIEYKNERYTLAEGSRSGWPEGASTEWSSIDGVLSAAVGLGVAVDADFVRKVHIQTKEPSKRIDPGLTHKDIGIR